MEVQDREEGVRLMMELEKLHQRIRKCTEVGMPHCHCITEANEIKQMAIRLGEIVGYFNVDHNAGGS